MADLGRWLNGDYRVPGAGSSADETRQPDDPDITDDLEHV